LVEKRRNTPSYKRPAKPKPMRLMSRDRAVLVSVYEYRVLTSHQIEALHFPSTSPTTRTRKSACQRRLQLLYQHKLLDRIIRPLVPGAGRETYAYTLAQRGADVVASTLGIDREGIGWRPKDSKMGPLFLDHLITTNTLRVNAELLVQAGFWSGMSWIDEIALKSEYQDKVPVRVSRGRPVRIFPDGYFTVHLPGQTQAAHFFVEVDQGTMTNKRWAEKMKTYITFRESGDSLQHFGTKNFRVLAITSSAKRLENLQVATSEAGAWGYFWFTTAEQLSIWQPTQLLQPIWHIAGEDELRPLF